MADFPVIGGVDATADPTVAVSGGAELYLQGIEISGNTGVGINASGARVYLDRTQVVDNNGGGLAVVNAAHAQVRNCFVGGTLDGLTFSASDTSTVDVTYSSILGGGGDATALACGAMADVEVRNSIVVGRGGAAFDIVCDAAITYSATESAYAGVGNVAIGDLTSGNQDVWFVDYVGNDFHVNTPPAAVLTTAEWTIVDPVVDIDGDARPTVDGTADFAGADVVP